MSIVKIGGFANVESVTIGGGALVVPQTMWKEPLFFSTAGEIKSVLSKIKFLRALGCRLLRFAVPDMSAAVVLGHLAEKTEMPLAADIHFDYKIALRCLDFPIAKLRINPGNIGREENVKAVLEKAREKKIPIRIGVNAGSLPRDLREKRGVPAEELLVEAAARELAVFDKYGFTDIVVSMKASSVKTTVDAARLFRKNYAHPLHIGVTEAGPLIAGVVRNTAALSELLKDGIGDTLRVSLSSTMENEIIAAREILALFADDKRVKLISCPRCGRATFDTHRFIERWEARLYAMDINLSIAAMGCIVNGPGEAKDAALGITGLGGKVVFFRKGEKTRELDVGKKPQIEADALIDAAFEEELQAAAVSGL